MLEELKQIRLRLERIEQLLAGNEQGVPSPSSGEELRSIANSNREPVVIDGIKISPEIPVRRLVNEAIVPLGNGHHVFVDIPDILYGRNYTPRDGYQGNLKFAVVQDQDLFVALYTQNWGGGGNPSGHWQHEVVSPADLENQGWKQVAMLNVKHSNPEYRDEAPWLVLARHCRAGEQFLIRNHKYQAPVLIWGTSFPAERHSE